MQLSTAIYRATESFPQREWYCLARQMRRAAVSVASNIAEGKGRRTDKDFSSFLYMARGSLLELETQVLLAHDLQYVDSQHKEALLKFCAAVGSALTGLINSLRPEQAVVGS